MENEKKMHHTFTREYSTNSDVHNMMLFEDDKEAREVSEEKRSEVSYTSYTSNHYISDIVPDKESSTENYWIVACYSVRHAPSFMLFSTETKAKTVYEDWHVKVKDPQLMIIILRRIDLISALDTSALKGALN
tara:strand:- start:97 stop:495 length:399 start_codon:yes stop_codon:yes gene_type:complete